MNKFIMERREELPKDVIHLVKLDPWHEDGYALISRTTHKPIIVGATLIYTLLFHPTRTPWESKLITSEALEALISKVKESGSPAQMVQGNLQPLGVLSDYYSVQWTDEKETLSQLESAQKIAA